MQASALAATGQDVVPLAQPFLNGRELELVAEVLQTRQLSDGPMRERFERSVAEYAGVEHAVAITSRAAALRVAALEAGWGEGDEVVTSPLASRAAIDAIRRTRATVVFADVDPTWLVLSPAAVEAAITERTRGILVVDTGGWPADVPALDTLARVHGLTMVEDASEALGAIRDARGVAQAASWGVAFGFDQDRQLAIGDGAMLCTDDPELARAWRDRIDHVRMSDVACAIGMAQLEKLPRMLGMRDHVAAEYARALRGIDAVAALPGERHDATFRSWSGYVVQLDDAVDRDSVVRGMHERGIEAGTPALHADGASTCPVAAAHAARSVALPLYPQLSPQQQHRVVEALRDSLADA